MALGLTISRDDYQSIGKNAISYQVKLDNQSKEINKIIEEINEVWNGKNSKIATDALKISSNAFKQMSTMIDPYVVEYKKLKESFKKVYGEMD